MIFRSFPLKAFEIERSLTFLQKTKTKKVDNILYTLEGGKLTIKVSDFGISRVVTLEENLEAMGSTGRGEFPISFRELQDRLAHPITFAFQVGRWPLSY